MNVHILSFSERFQKAPCPLPTDAVGVVDDPMDIRVSKNPGRERNPAAGASEEAGDEGPDESHDDLHSGLLLLNQPPGGLFQNADAFGATGGSDSVLEIQVPKPAANQLTAVGLLVRIPASAGAESSSRISFAQGRIVEMRVLDQLLSERVQGERDVGGDSIQSAQDIDVACIDFLEREGFTGLCISPEFDTGGLAEGHDDFSFRQYVYVLLIGLSRWYAGRRKNILVARGLNKGPCVR